MSKWSQDQYTRCDVSQIERKGKKNTSKPHYIPQCARSPYQKSPILTLPLTMTTLITKTTSPFCH